VNADKTVKRGIIATELTTSGDATIRPGDHIVSFVGDIPCDDNGVELDNILSQKADFQLGGNLTASCKFSSKPADGYANYYDKLSTYANILGGYAQAIDPTMTAKTHRPLATGEDSVFEYMDSATSRAHISAITEKLAGHKIAIVGLGGTGAYVLDQIAKTPVGAIHLYDGDAFYTHNAFRAPGAASIAELNSAPLKVDYFKRRYEPMHRMIIAHPGFITGTNVDELKGVDFVFLTLDSGAAKKLIIEKLESFGTPFIDTGMGVLEKNGSLVGILRTTLSTDEQRQHVAQRISLDDGGDNEYDQNIQISDLNALNAILAVIKWKKLCGFFLDLEHEFSSLYTIDGNHLLNEDQSV